jgi:hypothetical protein
LSKPNGEQIILDYPLKSLRTLFGKINLFIYIAI